MFPSFTGTSRRARNVNLSGQQHANPWGAASWSSPSAASGTGTSKSVSNAQAERQQRLLERQRLRAAGDIQRTWRAHCVRRELRTARRQAFDILYQQTPAVPRSERIPHALPLIITFFNPKSDQDIRRLLSFADDVLSTNGEFLSGNHASPYRHARLVSILVAALERETANKPGYGSASRQSGGDSHGRNIELILRLVCEIVSTSPWSISTSVNNYYALLGRLCEDRGLSQEFSGLVARAILAPLTPSTSAGKSA